MYCVLFGLESVVKVVRRVFEIALTWEEVGAVISYKPVVMRMWIVSDLDMSSAGYIAGCIGSWMVELATF